MKIVVLGAATVVGPIIKACGHEIVAVLNDNIPVGQSEGRFVKYNICGTSQDIRRYLIGDRKLILTMMTMKDKRGVWDKFVSLNVPDDKFASVIHPTSIIPQDGSCKVGCVIMAPLSQLSPGAEIKDNCILYGNSFIGHDSTLERYVVVANNASIQARVHIGRGVHVGSNSTILSGLKIGEFSLIGAGSVVTKDVPPDTIVAGVPAKPLNK